MVDIWIHTLHKNQDKSQDIFSVSLAILLSLATSMNTQKILGNKFLWIQAICFLANVWKISCKIWNSKYFETYFWIHNFLTPDFISGLQVDYNIKNSESVDQMFTAIFFFHFFLLSVHFFSCIWRCFFSSFEGVVHKKQSSEPMSEKKGTGFKYISLFPRCFSFLDIRAAFFAAFLSWTSKNLREQDWNILPLCITKTFQKEY